jgi:hypothetical protein
MLTRRRFTQLTAALALGSRLRAQPPAPLITPEEIAKIDHDRILTAANKALTEKPITITASHSSRSEGGPHDYFSEGDYWWPDPANPTGPYIRRDGMSNPDNFNNHREALIRLSLLVPQLAAAWLLTKDLKYASSAVEHLRAWFVTPATRMNPNLTYAQAIHGVSPGRGTGVIDTLHLVEVARAVRHLQSSPAFFAGDQEAVRNWFADYTNWMITSKNGKDEEKAVNNHGTCWVAQVASFAALTGNADAMALCRKRYRENLLPDQIAPDGSLPLELARTKPYSYSLFDLDILAVVCQIASAPEDNLWTYSIPASESKAPKTPAAPGGTPTPNPATAIVYKKAVDFYFPFIADKSKWPFPKDVEYFDDLPNRQPSLLFAGIAYNQPKYIALWKKLSPDPKTAEIVRNFPIRQPLLWVTPA